MKKFIMAVFTVFFAVTMYAVSAAGTEYPFSLSYSDAHVMVTTERDDMRYYKGTIIAAALEDGNITKVNVYENVDQGVYLNNDFNSGEKVKIMFWDKDSMEPMADSIEAEISNKMYLGVFNGYMQTMNVEHDVEVWALELLARGVKITFECRIGVNAEDWGLLTGDVVMYSVNNNREILEVKKLFSDGVDPTKMESVWSAAKADSAAMIDREYVQGLKEDNKQTDLYLGAVCDINRSENWIEVSDIKDNISDVKDGATRFYLDSAPVIYRIDYNERISTRVSTGSVSSIFNTKISDSGWIDEEKSKVDWSKNERTNPNLALIRCVDGEACDVVFIIPKKN